MVMGRGETVSARSPSPKKWTPFFGSERNRYEQENEAAESKPRKKYTEEFKRSVIDHWRSSGKSAVQVAQEFGVNIWNLRDWKRQYGR